MDFANHTNSLNYNTSAFRPTSYGGATYDYSGHGYADSPHITDFYYPSNSVAPPVGFHYNTNNGYSGVTGSSSYPGR